MHYHLELLRDESMEQLERVLGTRWKLSDVTQMLAESAKVSKTGGGGDRLQEVRIPHAVMCNPQSMEGIKRVFGLDDNRKGEDAMEHGIVRRRTQVDEARRAYQDQFFGGSEKVEVEIDQMSNEAAENIFDMGKDEFLGMLPFARRRQ